MAAGDLGRVQIAAADLARDFKKLLRKAKELRDFYDKTGAGNCDESEVAAPATKDAVLNFVTLCSAFQDFADDEAVSAADRRNVIERIANTPVTT